MKDIYKKIAILASVFMIGAIMAIAGFSNGMKESDKKLELEKTREEYVTLMNKCSGKNKDFSDFMSAYSCDRGQVSKTTRHELLHVVYEKLSDAEKKSVIQKLEKYRNEYYKEISIYPKNEQDGELFVRVGADGKSVDDIELINLYAQVSSAYLPKQQKYYSGLINETDVKIENAKNWIATHGAFTALGILTSGITMLAILFLKNLAGFSNHLFKFVGANDPNRL